MTLAAVLEPAREPSLDDATRDLERARARVAQREAEHATAVAALELARTVRVEAPDADESRSALAAARAAVDVAAEDVTAARGALQRAQVRHQAASRRAAAAERADIQRQREELLERFAPALDRFVEAAVQVDAAVAALEELCAEDCALASSIGETGIGLTTVRLAAQQRLAQDFMPPPPKPANLARFREALAAVTQPGTLAEQGARLAHAREEWLHATQSPGLDAWLALPSPAQRWDDASAHGTRLAAARRLLQTIEAASAAGEPKR